MRQSNTLRDAVRQGHPGRSGERNSRTSAVLTSHRGLPLLTQWVQLWSDRRLPPAFTEAWIQAKVTGGDKGRGKGYLTQVGKSIWTVPTRNLSHGQRFRSCVEDSSEDYQRSKRPQQPPKQRHDRSRATLTFYFRLLQSHPHLHFHVMFVSVRCMWCVCVCSCVRVFMVCVLDGFVLGF